MNDFYTAAPGETPPAIPAGPRLCNGGDMRVVHNAFLWAYERAPGLVRTSAAGDTARSGLVGRFLADLDATLHVHHEGEDELLWGLLETRAPACALHVGQMRAQHAQVQELLRRAAPLLTAWRASADPDTRDTLATVYEQMLAVLRLHLRREVVEIVPVAERTITEAEWGALARHGVRAIPASRMMLQLGMLLACSPSDERAAFHAAMPRFIRILYRLVGRRQYAAQYRALFPGEAVPQTV